MVPRNGEPLSAVAPDKVGSMTSPWTEDRVEKFKGLWADGLSAPKIAKQLGGGITRNGVIGKAQRLGLGQRRGRADFWNAEQTALLEYLWQFPGRVTTSSIASAINHMVPGDIILTRNSVIGKASRLNLPARAPGRTGTPKKKRLHPPYGDCS